MHAKNYYGLSEAEVIASREKNGENTLTKRKRKTFLQSFFANFGDPMIKILLIALGIQIVFVFSSSNVIETFGIAAAILVAVIVSTLSEYGSESAFERLQETALSIECRVRRGGINQTISVTELVVGDIVLLGSGDKIPADGEVVLGNLEVDQSLLNGESKEARKLPMLSRHKSDSSSVNFLDPVLLFSGTVVTGGEAVMRVTAVGDKTVYGKIASELQDTSPKSPLKVKLEHLAKVISVIGYIGAGMVAFSYLFKTFFIDNNFVWTDIVRDITTFKTLFPHLVNAATLVVSVIVMAVPEGLPMMITVVFSSNMKYMLRDNVLVRKLGGIETAGSMNVLFTDKTGTLTYGKLDVTGIITGDGKAFMPGKEERISRMLALSLSCNTSADFANGKAVGGNSTDRVLLDFSARLPQTQYLTEKITSIPFSSAYKYMATEVELSDEAVSEIFLADCAMFKKCTLIKGAPEKVIAKCDSYFTSSGERVYLDNTDAIMRKIEEQNKQAIRMVAVAVTRGEVKVGHEFPPLTLVALVAIQDQARKEAPTSVERLANAGIQTIMITGDARQTAVAIAKEVGILPDTERHNFAVLTSDEMAKMSDEELRENFTALRVVARALPSDKSRLVRIAQSLNLVVGMTGDGVNDAPALKKADIGFGMGSGTEVAKEASDIVILDDNINSISCAVSYGRTIFKSIRKFLIFKLTINFCAMSVSIIAPLLNVDTPITVIQMLWINLVMDTLAGLAFGGEKPRAKYMYELPKRRDEAIINRYMWNQIIVSSVFTALLSLWFLKSNIVQGMFDLYGPNYALTAFFTFFIFMNVFNSFNSRTHELNPLLHIRGNKAFVWIMLGVSLTQIVLTFFGGQVFRTEPLLFTHFIYIISLALLVIPADIVRKLFVRNHPDMQGT